MKFKIITILIIILVLIIAVVVLIAPILSNSSKKAPLLNGYVQSENLTSSSQFEAPTNEWSDYTNPFNTYTLKYPSSWDINEQKYFAENNIDLLASDITFTKNIDKPQNAQLSIHDYNEYCNNNQFVGYKDSKKSQQMVNGNKATLYQSDTDPQFKTDENYLTVYVFEGNKSCIEISVWQKDDNTMKQELDQIINSFTLKKS